MKNSKKFISFILAFVLIFSTMSVGLTAFAAEKMTFTLTSSSKAAKAGDIVTVTVNVKNSEPVCAVNPTVVYNTNQLEFISAENGTVFAKNAFSVGGAYEGKVRILYYNGVINTQKNGTVATLKFKVLEGAKGYAYINLEFLDGSVVNAKEEKIEVVSKQGSIPVISPVVYAGEAKDDNAIDGKYYQKVPLFASYKKQSVQLTAGIIGDTVKKVEWSVDSDRLTVDENGLVVPNRWWYCRANVTAKITSTKGDVYEETVMVEFFKLDFTKRLPVF